MVAKVLSEKFWLKLLHFIEPVSVKLAGSQSVLYSCNLRRCRKGTGADCMNTMHQNPDIATGSKVGDNSNKYSEWEQSLRESLSRGIGVPLSQEELRSVGFGGVLPPLGHENPDVRRYPGEIMFAVVIEPLVGTRRVKVSFKPSIFWVSGLQARELLQLKAALLPQPREIEAPEGLVTLPIPKWVGVGGTYDGWLTSDVMFLSEAQAAFQEFRTSWGGADSQASQEKGGQS